jgi:hypothetical protein
MLFHIVTNASDDVDATVSVAVVADVGATDVPVGATDDSAMRS